MNVFYVLDGVRRSVEWEGRSFTRSRRGPGSDSPGWSVGHRGRVLAAPDEMFGRTSVKATLHAAFQGADRLLDSGKAPRTTAHLPAQQLRGTSCPASASRANPSRLEARPSGQTLTHADTPTVLVRATK